MKTKYLTPASIDKLVKDENLDLLNFCSQAQPDDMDQLLYSSVIAPVIKKLMAEGIKTYSQLLAMNEQVKNKESNLSARNRAHVQSLVYFYSEYFRRCNNLYNELSDSDKEYYDPLGYFIV